MNKLKAFMLGIVIGIPFCIGSINAWTVKAEEPSQRFTSYVNTHEKVFGSEFDKEPTQPQAMRMEATAYCLKGKTATGKEVREGYAAAAKELIGLTAFVYTTDGEFLGTYEIEDTGSDERIQSGECIDIYIADEKKAKEFGRKEVEVYFWDARG